MYSFQNDYSELAHNDILVALTKLETEQNLGYGHDKHSKNAKRLIQNYLTPDCDIHFLTGGTSANKIIISHILRSFEAIIAVETGHINVHEAGAIEASGYKILTVKGVEGKITPLEVREVVKANQDEHSVVPRLVYISNSTELGTIYTKTELKNLYETCLELDLYLFIDGARLGAALTADDNDLTLKDIATFSDIFYIGGTKNGALFGEAAIIKNPKLKHNFKNTIKLNGGLLAKGFILGAQFEALFTNNLFFRLAKYANGLAKKITQGLKKLSIPLAQRWQTNQVFPILDEKIVTKLKEDYHFDIWETRDGKQTIRLVTSWAININEVDAFLETLAKLL